MKEILTVSGLTKQFQTERTSFQAVRSVSFYVGAGECLGLIGESGSGKSTIANMVAGFLEPTQGEIEFLGQNLRVKSARQARLLRREMQMVFQDPVLSFSPKMRLIDSIGEGLRYYTGLTKTQREKKALEAMELVGLPFEYAKRKNWEISGGECQRAAIARSILIRPQLLICDEVTSALDVSVQAQIVHLLHRLKQEMGMAYLFISHDLALVGGLCDRIAVLYQGEILELGTAGDIIHHPKHPYTQALLDSVFVVDEKTVHKKIVTVVEQAQRKQSSCCFAAKCPHYQDECSGGQMVPISSTHTVKCSQYQPVQ